jgi:hypothetical protein
VRKRGPDQQAPGVVENVSTSGHHPLPKISGAQLCSYSWRTVGIRNLRNAAQGDVSAWGQRGSWTCQCARLTPVRTAELFREVYRRRSVLYDCRPSSR